MLISIKIIYKSEQLARYSNIKLCGLCWDLCDKQESHEAQRTNLINMANPVRVLVIGLP